MRKSITEFKHRINTPVDYFGVVYLDRHRELFYFDLLGEEDFKKEYGDIPYENYFSFGASVCLYSTYEEAIAYLEERERNYKPLFIISKRWKKWIEYLYIFNIIINNYKETKSKKILLKEKGVIWYMLLTICIFFRITLVDTFRSIYSIW